MRNKPSVIITGAAGFIGSALAERFIKANYKVIGIDNINDYYDINLKKSRLKKHRVFEHVFTTIFEAFPAFFAKKFALF